MEVAKALRELINDTKYVIIEEAARGKDGLEEKPIEGSSSVEQRWQLGL